MTTAVRGNQDPIIVSLRSGNDSLDEEFIRKRCPGESLSQPGYELRVNSKEPADVVIILGHLRKDEKLTARPGYVFRWDQEPQSRVPFSRTIDRFYTHLSDPGNARIVPSPPILDWYVDRSYDALANDVEPLKTETLSVIASTMTKLAGHRARGALAEAIAKEIPVAHLYGRGRERELSDKAEGLFPYRYSVAVENTSRPHYWTEKISDCFVSLTVPFYFGAPNITEYFPEEALIPIPVDDPERAIAIIRETLHRDDYEARLPALREAKRLVLEKYSLHATIGRIVSEEADLIRSRPRRTRTLHGRLTRRLGWIRGKGIRVNLREQWAKRVG